MGGGKTAKSPAEKLQEARKTFVLATRPLNIEEINDIFEKNGLDHNNIETSTAFINNGDDRSNEEKNMIIQLTEFLKKLGEQITIDHPYYYYFGPKKKGFNNYKKAYETLNGQIGGKKHKKTKKRANKKRNKTKKRRR